MQHKSVLPILDWVNVSISFLSNFTNLIHTQAHAQLTTQAVEQTQHAATVFVVTAWSNNVTVKCKCSLLCIKRKPHYAIGMLDYKYNFWTWKTGPKKPLQLFLLLFINSLKIPKVFFMRSGTQ